MTREYSPIFSIIVPTYNRPSFLSEAISSVLNQSFQDFEIIIIDDKSSDENLQKVAAIASQSEKIRLHLHSHNQGVSKARNTGISLAKGNYIHFLDDDDAIEEEFLASAERILSNQGNVDVALLYSTVHPQSQKELFQYHVVKEALGLQPIKTTYSRDNPTLLFKLPPQINSMVFKREVFKNNDFDVYYRFGEDLLLWLKILKDGYRFSMKPTSGGKDKALVRVHGEDRLSQPNNEDVIRFLDGLKRHYSEYDQSFKALINLRLIMRYMLVQDYAKCFKLIVASAQHPFSFIGALGFQFNMKSRTFFSYMIYLIKH